IGRRIMLQSLYRKRIEAARRDRIVGERGAGGACRIGNRSGEHAIALGHTGHHALAGDSGSQSRTLPVGEEKRLVLADRPTDREPVLVSTEFRPRTWLREIVPGVQILIADEL